ncbi:MAG: PQQ-binding-like beta-propeller repeat protein [Verrucomicrobia bacterium]|nr:PQQ-binding-like beta-propeller repeat protein [Verrucomicrobiota bacterium]
MTFDNASPRRTPRASAARSVPLALALWLPVSTVLSANWPAWRGPHGSGVCTEKNLPLTWSATNNIRWRVPLPDRGNSTPIVWGRRVFVTQAIDKDNRRVVLCFARADGKLLWQSGVNATDKEPTYEANPYCSSSPVTDGQRVIAWFGSAGVHCYDFQGKELWARDLGRQAHQWGYGASLLLYRELCILSFGPGERSFLIALAKRTGKTVWQVDWPHLRPDAKWEDYGGSAEHAAKPGAQKLSEIAGSWSTPIVVRAAGHDELVNAFPLVLLAVDPQSGRERWRCAGLNIGAYSSPFAGEGTIAVTSSGFVNVGMAVRPGGRGDITSTRRLWHRERIKAHVGSGVVHRGHAYLVSYEGFAQCLDLRTGATVWEERLTGSGARNGCWSSPVLAGDRLYLANQNADTFVLRASPKFELVQVNSLGGEPMNASLAVSNGEIFIRTDKNLWCIGQAKQKSHSTLSVQWRWPLTSALSLPMGEGESQRGVGLFTNR